MRRWGILVGTVLLLSALGSSPTRGQGGPPLPFLSGASSTDALAGNLRGYLIEHIPPVLVEDHHHWGQQKLVTRRLEWKGQGKVLPQAQKSYKNHGVWRRIKVTANNLGETLVFD